MRAKKPVISAQEYVDQIAANWPPLTDEGREELSRVIGPVVRARAAKVQPTGIKAQQRRAAA